MHHHSSFTDSHNLLGVTVYGYDGRFVNHHLVVVHDNGVGCTEVNCKFLIKERK